MRLYSYKPSRGESADSQTSEIEQTTAPETEPPYHGVTEDFSAQAKEYLDGVAGIDCGGAVIKIVSTSPELTGEDSAPEIISRAVKERNAAVEEKYNISLVTASADSATMYAELSASLKSGMYYADMLNFPQSTIPSLAAAGMLYNLRSMPGMKLDTPYFNQSAVEAASAGYRILAVAGEATYSPYSFPAVFFSVDKLNAAGLELPYKSAKAGTWTWDEFYSYCTAALGAGYGTVCTGDTGDFALDCAFFSAGGKLISAGAMKYPTVALTEDNSNAIIDMLSRIFKTDGALTGESGGHGAFTSCVFMIDTMGSLYTMADSAEPVGNSPDAEGKRPIRKAIFRRRPRRRSSSEFRRRYPQTNARRSYFRRCLRHRTETYLRHLSITRRTPCCATTNPRICSV